MNQTPEEILKSYLQDYEKRIINEIYSYTMEADTPTDCVELLHKMQQVRDNIERLKAYSPEAFKADIISDVKRSFSDKVFEYRQALSDYKFKYEDQIAELKEQREKRIQEAKKAFDDFVAERKKLIEESLTNYYKLIKRKSEVEDLLRLYQLDFDSYDAQLGEKTLEEIEEDSTKALSALNQVTRSPSLLHVIMRFVYKPLELDTLEEKQCLILKISWTIAFILACYGSKPVFMGVLGIIYFIDCFANMLDAQSKIKILQMVYAHMQDVDVNEYIEDDVKYFDLQSDIEEAEAVDLTEDIKAIEDKCKDEEASIKANNPESDIDKAVAETEAFLLSDTYEELIGLTTKNINAAKERVLGVLDLIKETLDAKYQEIRSKLNLLGESITMDEYLNPKMKIGCLYAPNGEAFVESYVPIGACNTLFSFKDEDNRSEVLRYLKLLLVNYLSNIRENHLIVSIYDSNDMGRDFIEFISNQKMKPYIDVYAKDLKNKLEDVATELMMRTKKLNGSTIYEYNKHAQEIGKLTMEYELIILLSSDYDYLKDKTLKKFLKYSDKEGIIFWIVNKEILFDPEDMDACKAYKALTEILPTVNDYGSYKDTEGTNMAVVPDGFTPYEYNESMGLSLVDKFLANINDKHRNSNALLYEENFRSKYIPDDKIWTYSTLKGIDILFGLVEGDPERPTPYTLGDGNVHMLMGGQTGAGKSATINQFLANMLYMYSPEELELVMVDFKNVEFKMYTGKYAIPHTSIIAGTKDGEYAISIFQYLLDEMDRRVKLFGTIQVNHIMLWNKHCKDIDRMDLYLPRVAVVVDEFQTMFNKVDQKSLEIIKKAIADVVRLARFCGVHLIFTSQSMKGTMSKDILDNFSLRAALRCTAEVSTEIIGNPASSKIKERFGWITLNDSTGQNPEANRLYRIPFIPEETIHTYIPMLQRKCEEEGHINRHAKFYDEDETHSGEDLARWYETCDNFNNYQSFILGERTAFSTNKLPCNFKITKGYNENILFNAFEIEDQCRFIDSMIYQLKAKKIKYLVHCPDLELSEVMGIKDKVDEKYWPWLDDGITVEDVRDTLLAAIQARKENPELVEEPFYFIGIGWDSIQGLGRNSNDRVVEVIKNLLYEGPKYNYHFILTTSTLKEMRTWKACFKRCICGQHSENESMWTIDTARASRLPEGFAIYQYGTKITQKFKLYRFPLVKPFSAKEEIA